MYTLIHYCNLEVTIPINYLEKASRKLSYKNIVSAVTLVLMLLTKGQQVKVG